MSTIAIKAHNLSKHFHIGARQERYSTLRDAVSRALMAPFRYYRKAEREKRHGEQIWALRDLNFEIKHGDVVGVIGRNGAGKSTLLKILSRITDPSGGYAEIRGRVGSLLEVGTGFHLELSGRENIYLNGAILGMSRVEIESNFDEIVAFSGVEKFIDTPVKHYSSGMYLRLAFAVAAHFQPEILLVDEVLAVGDAEFQKRCLGKMGDIAKEGRTVLFVSHNLAAVRELCKTAIVLGNGKLDFYGRVVDGISHYSRGLNDSEPDSAGNSTRWRGVELVGSSAATGCMEVARDEEIAVRAKLDLAGQYGSVELIFLIDDAAGDTVVNHRMRAGTAAFAELHMGVNEMLVSLPPLWLAPGVYTAFFKFKGRNYDGYFERHISDRAIFEVPGSLEDLGRALLAPLCQWDIRPEKAAVVEAAALIHQ